MKLGLSMERKKCKDGETDNRGGRCLCIICNDKRHHYTVYKEYGKTLIKKVRQDAKAKLYIVYKIPYRVRVGILHTKLYTGKLNEKSGNMKKTWEMIISLWGKGKRQIKPTFLIDNEKITNRRVIANEFNKYFVSLATNLNKATKSFKVNCLLTIYQVLLTTYQECGQKIFSDYMSSSFNAI